MWNAMRWAASASMIALAGATAAQAQIAQEPRVALVVGVSDYTTVGDLRNAVNDARSVAATLQALDFDVVLLEDADQVNFEVAVMDFADRTAAAGPDALALFFFAGHGVQHDGVNYMLPGDIDVNGPGLLSRRGIEASWVMGVMDAAGVAAKVMILDACRDNPFADAWASETRSGLARGLAEMARPSGSVVMFSTSPGSVALDGSGDNSPFTTALVEEVQKPGVLLETTFKNIVRSVGVLTEQQQAPYLEGSFTGDFYLGGPPAAADAPDAGLPTATDTDDWFWSVVSASGEADDLRAYLDQFPEGKHAAEAQQRLALLDALEAPAPPAVEVGRLRLASSQPEYSGRCPATLSFKGVIETASGSGPVSYRFVRSDGTRSPIETVEFEERGRSMVAYSWTLNPSEPFTGWVRLETLGPDGPTKSAQADVSVTCVEPLRPPADLKLDPRFVGKVADAALTAPRISAALAARAPVQVEPLDGAVFDIFPRTMTLSWKPSIGAAGYVVEVDAFGACKANAFCSEVGGSTQIVKAGLANSVDVGFVGAQPGRWRVWALDAKGNAGAKSGWREFLHKK